MRVRSAVLPALLTLGALAAPAGAQAATLTANAAKPCYGAGDRVSLTGAGFTPGGPVRLTQGLRPLNENPTADATGAFSGSAGVQQITAKAETVSYGAVDQTNPALVANTQPLRFSRLSGTIKKAGANGLIQRFRGRGFTTGSKFLYVHVRRGGRNVKTLRLGRLKGPCRTLNARKRFFSSGARTGAYQISFDSFRRYKKGRPQQLRSVFNVFRTFRRSSTAIGAVAATSSASSVLGSWR